LSERLPPPSPIEPSEIGTRRDAEYLYAQPSIPISNWQPLLTLNGKAIVFARGTPATGILVYSSVPLCRLARKDLQQICGIVLDQVKHARAKVDGLLEHEVVMYRGKETTFFSIKNHTGENGVLTVKTPTEPLRIFPRSDETHVDRQDDAFKLELSFKPREVRIVEYP